MKILNHDHKINIELNIIIERRYVTFMNNPPVGAGGVGVTGVTTLGPTHLRFAT